MSRPVALITGPTSGLGEGFARRYAMDGHDLVLVARDVERLERLAAELHDEVGADVEVMPADLAVDSDRAKVADRLTAGVQTLVNNAGFGTAGEFWTADFGLMQRQLDVNVTAVMQLTHAALPADAVRRFWHRDQRRERRGPDTRPRVDVLGVQGVGDRVLRRPGQRPRRHRCRRACAVSRVHPHRVPRTRGDRLGSHKPAFLWLEVEDVVRDTMADVAKGKVVIVPGLQYKALTTGGRVVPRNLLRAMTKVVGRGRGRT